MMKKDTYFVLPKRGITTPITCAILMICFLLYVYFDYRRIENKEPIALIDWISIVVVSAFPVWLLFNAIWDIQWVRFEKDRIVLANPFSRNLKSIEYSDMELKISQLPSLYSDDPRLRSSRQLWICIYSKEHHSKHYKYGGCNFFGKHRMHINYDDDVYERLEKLAEKTNKEEN